VGGSHSSASFAHGKHRSRRPAGRPASARAACPSASVDAADDDPLVLPSKSLNAALFRDGVAPPRAPWFPASGTGTAAPRRGASASLGGKPHGGPGMRADMSQVLSVDEYERVQRLYHLSRRADEHCHAMAKGKRGEKNTCICPPKGYEICF